MVGILYDRIKLMYVDIMVLYPQNIEVMFKLLLNQGFNLRELRVIGVKFANVVISRTTKPILIHILWQHFSSRIYLPQQLETTDWIEARRLPTHPDPIPTFARDLEHEAREEAEDNITWYVDRTPSTITFEEQYQRFLSNALTNTRPPPIILPPRIRRNLNQDFNTAVRKYNIIPELLVSEDENFENCDDCPICYESVKLLDSVKVGCGHKFCGECIVTILETHHSRQEPCCALCRGVIQKCIVNKQEVYDRIVKFCNL